MLTHKLELCSSYKKEPAFTNYTETYKGTLDYVFFNDLLITCLGSVEGVKEDEAKDEVALPNSKHSSDHVPLVSLFVHKSDFERKNNVQQQQMAYSRYAMGIDAKKSDSLYGKNSRRSKGKSENGNGNNNGKYYGKGSSVNGGGRNSNQRYSSYRSQASTRRINQRRRANHM